VPPQGFDAHRITNARGLCPTVSGGEPHEAAFPTAMPEAPFCAFDVAPSQFAQVSIRGTRPDAGGEAPWLRLPCTTTTGTQTADPDAHVTERGAKGGRVVSLAQQLRPAMLTSPKPLPHRRDLGSDNLRLGCRYQPLSLIQRQAESFGGPRNRRAQRTPPPSQTRCPTQVRRPASPAIPASP
jgi:hypothetical protein